MTRLEADWVARPATQRVFAVLADGGHPAWFVGGCVRNALLGQAVGDIDIATPAPPNEVTELCRKAGLKVVPTGVDHGTVTVVSDHVSHEVTTFRRDVATDGRRAVVAYSTDMAEDARRRDFTMNALYADRHGLVVDPLGGLKDLTERRVVFIEDANMRIREDVLRILRFFRFHAWYGDDAAGMDAEALAAISANISELDTLPAERVGAEMVKLLAAPDPAPALAAMRHSGVLAHVLPGADTSAIAPLVALESGLAPDPVRRLVALGGPDPTETLRLSRVQSRTWRQLRDIAETGGAPAAAAYRHGEDAARGGLMVRAAMLSQPLPADFGAELARGAAMRLPVAAADLAGLSGAALGRRLGEIESRWIASDFTLTRADLLKDG